MINRLEGYTGDGFNQRRAYIGKEIGKRFQHERDNKDKLKQENKMKMFKENEEKNNYLKSMSNLLNKKDL